MSSYRNNYVPWNKSSISTFGTSTKPDTSSTKSKYEAPSLSRPSSRAEIKPEPEKSGSKINTSYRPTSTYTTSNQRDRSTSREPTKYSTSSVGTTASCKDPEKPQTVREKLGEKYGTQEKTSVRDKYQTPEKTPVRDKYSSSTNTYPTRTDLTTRVKPTAEKKEPPPVSYRSISRTGTRSRDPSPIEREKTETNSNYRLYPRSYSRSSSREPEPLKYSSRTSSKEDLSSLTSRYGGRSSRADTKDDLSGKLRSTSQNARELSSSLPRYSVSRHNSKEDLTIPSSKYITSRFLPKNTVEKSYTAYSRPSTRSTSLSLDDKKIKSRDNLMAVLNHSARTSPILAKEEMVKTPPKPVVVQKQSSSSDDEETEVETDDEIEMETVTVVTRGTSPTFPSHSSFIRTRRADMARVIQKDITRPKKRNTVDKEMQSDRLDDTARYSRYGSTSTVAAPWSSYLDLKYNSPRTTYSPRYSSTAGYTYKTKDKSDSKENSASLDLSDKSETSNKTELSSSSHSLGGDKSASLKLYDKSLSSKSLPEKSPSSRSISERSATELSIPENDRSSTELSSSSKCLAEKSTSNNVYEKSSTDLSCSLKSEKSSTELSSSLKSDKVDKPKTLRKASSSSSESLNSLTKNNSSKSIAIKTKSKEVSSKSDSSKSNGIPQIKSNLESSKSNGVTSKTSPDSSEASKSNGVSPKTSLESSETSKSNGLTPKTSLESSETSKSNGVTPKTSLESSEPSKSNGTSSKSKLPSKQSSPENSSKKQLPPIVPKTESTSKSANSLTQNKDFRKSVLNMNPDGKKKSPNRSNSVSSDSEPNSAAPELKLTTSQSLPKLKLSNSLSKLPQRTSQKEENSRRSPSVSSETSSTTSSSEDDRSNKKKLSSSRTSMQLSSADDLSLDRPSKPPPSPRLKTEVVPKSETETKSFLMRALAPVTNFFKVKHQDSSDKIPDTEDSKFGKNKRFIQHVESGERAWWLDESSTPPEGVQKVKVSPPKANNQSGVKKQEAEEEPWWLNDNSDISEGVERLVGQNGSKMVEVNDGKNIYKIRRNESGMVEWWLDENNEDKSKNKSDFVQSHKIRHIDSGDRAWWANSEENLQDDPPKDVPSEKKMHKLFHQDSGEKAWWLMSTPNIPDGIKKLSDSDSDSDDSDKNEPLGDRASPEGLEQPPDSGRLSPYDNIPEKPKRPNHIPLFISRHTNIDDILGGSNQLLSPLMDRIYGFQDCEQIDPDQVRVHDSTAQRSVIQPNRIDVVDGCSADNCKKLDDAALQLYKDGDYGSYLDLEASISEQQEEFDGFQTNKKNSIVLRTQLSVRVHTITEKLLTSEGRELRRALFSLKQIFQEDKDLVHEFVQNDGLACLIKVGSEADQNYQNYILRALGQVMLYVDGMNGVMEHNQTVQWLYTLIASKFRLVVKTALKLLLVFVEYTDSNCMLLIKAVNTVDSTQGLMSWTNIMRLLKDFNSADTELLIYAMTLVNKCLNGIPDQDTYYDQTDALEEQGIEGIIQRYMSKQGTDLDLLQQFQMYEAVLQHEDGEDKGMPLRHLDESIRKTLRNRKSVVDSAERRKSRRHSTGNTPLNVNHNNNNNKLKFYSQTSTVDDEDESSSQSSGPNDHNLNGSYKENNKETTRVK